VRHDLLEWKLGDFWASLRQCLAPLLKKILAALAGLTNADTSGSSYVIVLILIMIFRVVNEVIKLFYEHTVAVCRLRWGMYSVSQKNSTPPEDLWQFFQNGWEFFNQSLHAYYAFLSMLDYGFLFNYLQL